MLDVINSGITLLLLLLLPPPSIVCSNGKVVVVVLLCHCFFVVIVDVADAVSPQYYPHYCEWMLLVNQQPLLQCHALIYPPKCHYGARRHSTIVRIGWTHGGGLTHTRMCSPLFYTHFPVCLCKFSQTPIFCYLGYYGFLHNYLSKFPTSDSCV